MMTLARWGKKYGFLWCQGGFEPGCRGCHGSFWLEWKVKPLLKDYHKTRSWSIRFLAISTEWCTPRLRPSNYQKACLNFFLLFPAQMSCVYQFQLIPSSYFSLLSSFLFGCRFARKLSPSTGHSTTWERTTPKAANSSTRN